MRRRGVTDTSVDALGYAIYDAENLQVNVFAIKVWIGCLIDGTISSVAAVKRRPIFGIT